MTTDHPPQVEVIQADRETYLEYMRRSAAKMGDTVVDSSVRKLLSGEMDDAHGVQIAALARRRLASTPQPSGEGWRNIASAPKDGTPFDAWVPDAFGGRRMCGLSFNRRGQIRQHGALTTAELPRWPTHWMPLPAAPGSSQSSDMIGEAVAAERERCARIAEGVFANHGATLRTQRSHNYEIAGKRIANAIRLPTATEASLSSQPKPRGFQDA